MWVLIVLGSVLTAAVEKKGKHETKPLPASPPTKAQQASKTQNTTELKTGKRGAYGEKEQLGPFKEDSRGRVGQADLKAEIAHHSPIVTEKVVYVHVPLLHPYPVEYFKHVPYPVKVPVPVVVHKPFPVAVPSPFHITVEKKVPFPVVKHVPIDVKAPVEVSGDIPVEIPVPEQYTLPVSKTIPFPASHSDIKHNPVYISQYPESQEIHNQEVYKANQHEEIVPAYHVSTSQTNHYVKISNIAETRLPETYKTLIPEENYQQITLPERHQYQNLAEYEYKHSGTPEDYQHEAKSPGVSSHELGTFGGHEAGLVGIGYLSPGHGAERHGFSYQSVNTH